jgi:hypothetical protein
MNINEAHYKFGHFSEALITWILKSCEACVLHKAKKRPVPKVTSLKATRPGKKLYMDTSGPFLYTLGGHQYWINLKDQYSGMSWNNFMKHKHEVPN